MVKEVGFISDLISAIFILTYLTVSAKGVILRLIAVYRNASHLRVTGRGAITASHEAKKHSGGRQQQCETP